MSDTRPVATLAVWVQAGASRRRIVGMIGDALKIAVTEPPEKGHANRAVEKLLAAEFGLPASAVKVVSGISSRRKTVRLTGVNQARVEEFVAENSR